MYVCAGRGRLYIAWLGSAGLLYKLQLALDANPIKRRGGGGVQIWRSFVNHFLNTRYVIGRFGFVASEPQVHPAVTNASFYPTESPLPPSNHFNYDRV